ncbi:MAG: hypothetical protein HON68_09555 [Gammaproteobacteria bacterium]|jgi:hypothetical protein|nr:hypothetical protein [Gammaproteobacteria bacterium]MBT3490633.1 hypothetical protein [Gammaproteobacteria bacterium]MBT3719213.1 hypothetical protein [Gammaproteobacteria bacterium]MBT3844988.1 hypothetical protein [Gammaproteobacteria bacterium]MBT4302082.1 hypothetical protein [Gammaproteobacteria bacterium]
MRCLLSILLILSVSFDVNASELLFQQFKKSLLITKDLREALPEKLPEGYAGYKDINTIDDNMIISFVEFTLPETAFEAFIKVLFEKYDVVQKSAVLSLGFSDHSGVIFSRVPYAILVSFYSSKPMSQRLSDS